MNLPTNGESNKGFKNETTKPSKYFPNYTLKLFCLRGSFQVNGGKWTQTRNGMLGVALSLLAPKYR